MSTCAVLPLFFSCSICGIIIEMIFAGARMEVKDLWIGIGSNETVTFENDNEPSVEVERKRMAGFTGAIGCRCDRAGILKAA